LSSAVVSTTMLAALAVDAKANEARTSAGAARSFLLRCMSLQLIVLGEP
jgi:hypothetical protein